MGECFLIANKEPKHDREVVPEVEINHDPLEGVKECAAVIQRGILKKINPSFAELLGYNVNDVEEKSIFDFIVPEGFSTLENYYFKRLKGEDITSFETVFFTRYNTKLTVKVTTKPTTFNGEKAEVAIFKKINEKQK